MMTHVLNDQCARDPDGCSSHYKGERRGIDWAETEVETEFWSLLSFFSVPKEIVMSSLMQHFPVSHKNFSVDIKGNKTDIVVCSYDDHFLVIATQIGTMGTILQARKEEGMSIHPTFKVAVIFGKRDEPMLVACARQLIEQISSSGSSQQLVLSLGLKDHSAETLKGIVSAVTENRLW